ncbi:MAG: alginate lyase family protein [Pyrinomonadaceae bacterium]|nr:alginate lyase family protein [Pyrinomonadaceae bacterium]
MTRVLKKLKKLRGRSLREMRVRVGQQLAALSERRGWSEQSRVPGDEEFFKAINAAALETETLTAEALLENFRTRRAPRFFASFDRPEETIAQLRSRWPGAEEAITGRARRITEGRFDLLGFRDLSFGQTVDWHLEPLSGKRAPLEHWSRIDYLKAEVAGDKKITWELNRQQYFSTLGRAYWLTGEELYAETFVSHISSWMDENPPKLGINWASSLEVSLRAISWLWALHFFRCSNHLTPELYLRVLKFLYLHARHLETYLSTYFSPNTHLTGEALGLFYLGTLLPEFRRAEAWRASGRSILLEELDRHVRSDGVYFEQSSYYHLYTTDFYTHLYLLSRANGREVEPKVEEKLKALLDHLMYITRPDGTTPFYGDDDGGRLVMLDERAGSDFSAALSTGALLFSRGDYKFVAGSFAEETLWLLGAEGAEEFDKLSASAPASESRAFTEGGYYVMRDGWTRGSNYLLVDCGPHGGLKCGHAHSDALSFDMAARGRNLLVDPGTYTYTGSREMRDYFRSTAAHNTLTLDEESQSVPGGAFDWKAVARSSVRRWTSRARFDFFEGAHDGYERLTEPATHARSILFIKGDYWIVRDRVETKGTHASSLHFHFAPDAVPEPDATGGVEGILEEKADAPGLALFAFGHEGRWQRSEGWVSQCYGQRVQSPVWKFSALVQGAQDFVSFIIPQAAHAAKSFAREVEAVEGRAFETSTNAVRDILLMANGALAEYALAASDFEWVWLRFEHGSQTPSEALLINGHRFMLNGREALASAEPLAYLFMRRVGEVLYVDSEERPELDAECFGARRLIFTDAVSDDRTEFEEAVRNFEVSL